MSGGEYNYMYLKVAELAEDIALQGDCYAATPATRSRFKTFLGKVAKALKAIEYNDSGDGDKDEVKLLTELVGSDWTHEVPKGPGWYWFCNHFLQTPRLVKVWHYKGKPDQFFTNEDGGASITDDDYKGKWKFAFKDVPENPFLGSGS